jgi:hypothetical protein
MRRVGVTKKKLYSEERKTGNSSVTTKEGEDS